MEDTPFTEDITVEKVVEVIGRSPNGWKEAVAHTLTEAAKTVRNIKEIDVKRLSAKVEKNQITEYRAVVKITFTVERGI